MPREKITFDERIEFLSILNELGKVDQNLEPENCAPRRSSI